MIRASLLVISVLAIWGCGEAPPAKDADPPANSGAAVPVPPVSAQPPETATTADIPAVSSPPRSNRYLQIAVTHAGFDPAGPQTSSGQRHYTVGLKGIGRARGNNLELDLRTSVFAQNERGCIARPELEATWLRQPLGATATFATAGPTEGQLSFLIPEDSQRLRILIATTDEANLIVPVGEEFEPAWPAPQHTIEDGSTLRVLVLPALSTPAILGAASAGRERVVLDFVVQNLKDTQGIEFTTSQQLRLVDATGAFVQPSTLTRVLGCRLDDGDVIPPGHSRRFAIVYEMPADSPRRLQYRGFEVDETIVDLD